MNIGIFQTWYVIALILVGIINCLLFVILIRHLVNLIKTLETFCRVCFVNIGLSICFLCILSILEMILFRGGLLYNFILSILQGILLLWFYQLLSLLIGGDWKAVEILQDCDEDFTLNFLVFPCCCLGLCIRGRTLVTYLIDILRILVVQVTITRPTLLFAALLSKEYNVFIAQELWFRIVILVSILLAIYSINVMRYTFRKLFRDPLLSKKSAVIQIFILISNLQPMILSVISSSGAFDNFPPPFRGTNFTAILNSSLLTVELIIVTPLYIQAFSEYNLIQLNQVLE